MSHIIHRTLKADPPLALRGEGVHLYDEAGRAVMDGSGGAAVACLGHGHPRVIAAIKAQFEELKTEAAAKKTAIAEARKAAMDKAVAERTAIVEKAEALDDPRLSVRCSLARARQSWREGDWARATRLLTATAESALLARDTETRVIALMMQGTGLALDGQEAPSAAAFDEALALCRSEGDSLHRAATLINRTFLWRLRGELASAEADLRDRLERIRAARAANPPGG